MNESDKKEIDAMTQIDMARALRFCPPSHRYFLGDTGDYFFKTFREKGSMTPKISKEIGWTIPTWWRIP